MLWVNWNRLRTWMSCIAQTEPQSWEGESSICLVNCSATCLNYCTSQIQILRCGSNCWGSTFPARVPGAQILSPLEIWSIWSWQDLAGAGLLNFHWFWKVTRSLCGWRPPCETLFHFVFCNWGFQKNNVQSFHSAVIFVGCQVPSGGPLVAVASAANGFLLSRQRLQVKS